MSGQNPVDASDRREFLKSSSAAVVGGSLAASLGTARSVHAAGSDVIRVGLVGCGGRGSGAAGDALSAGKDIRLVAMADAFADQLDHSRAVLQRQFGEQVAVTDDHCFVGLDAYQKVIASDVDVVLLATPPGFRPVHFRAAVEANKHVFTEKPMATDAPGVRSIMETVELSKQKNLNIVAGFCWRYDNAKRALFEQVHNGAIGELMAAFGTYLTSPVKPMPPASKRPEGMSDLEWMVRNWYNFTWLSGDGLVEQAIHTVDWLAWAFRDQPPESCTAVGGRQIPSEGGNIYDHVEVNYVWPNQVRGFLAQRQISNCHNENNLYLLGTKGVAQIQSRGVRISGETDWKYEGPGNNMYRTEHVVFFDAIRSGKIVNDGDRMAKSTLMGIMGRMAAYTGKQLTWEMALASEETLVPPGFPQGWGTEVTMPKMALPGVTPFV
ncbi:MAG: Gfo/Idh/MocA family protein [Pirellulaceae bacterium]